MHWYIYNNTVPLLNIVKIQTFHLVYIILKILSLGLFCLPACQPACLSWDLVALVLWLQIFHTRMVIASSLWNCYSEKGLSTAPWSFLLSVTPFLSSNYITQKQLLAHVNIIMNHTPIHNRHDDFDYNLW